MLDLTLQKLPSNPAEPLLGIGDEERVLRGSVGGRADRGADAGRRRFGAVDNRDALPYHLFDCAAEDGVVGAAEDEGVDAGVEEGGEVDLGDFAGYVRVCPSLLGEGDEERGGGLDDFDLWIELVDRFRVRLGA